MHKLVAILGTGMLGMPLFATVDLQGRIHAQGAGLAHFSGGGFLEGRLAAGVIIVKGDPARVDVEGYGRKYRIDDGFVYEGARGKIDVVGCGSDKILASVGAVLHLAGNWDVTPHGHGVTPLPRANAAPRPIIRSTLTATSVTASPRG